MSKKTFDADHWITSSSKNGDSNPPLKEPQSLIKKDFKASDFFIQGWKGESLPSKATLRFQECLNLLCQDAEKQFFALKGLNRSMKQAVFDEFLTFAESQNAQCHAVHSRQEFWQHMQNIEGSPCHNILLKFSKVYSLRAVVIYIFKIRFISLLSSKTSHTFNEDNLLSPSSFLSQIFRPRSSTELHCESLQANQYTWFRPTPQRKKIISELTGQFSYLTISEMMKIISQTKTGFLNSVEEQDSSPAVKDNFSHSLSHKNFGLFINQLLIRFPIWLKEDNPFSPSMLERKGIKTLNTKFSGDFLNSLIQSHWLAQDNNSYQQWDEILCPDFIDQDLPGQIFLKLCHELQFLCFLLKVASRQNHDPIALICQVMRDKYSSATENAQGQFSLFSCYDAEKELLYHRHVLMLPELPSKNPHHFLLKKIQEQESLLANDGLLYVFTNQKFFVPSRGDKTEQLLKSFKLEASFSFEELKGRGKIPNYLYVLTKRNMGSLDKTFLQTIKQVKKDALFSFRFSGELNHFQQFENAINEFDFFLQTKKASLTPIYQNKKSTDFSFEFFQDAIMEGKLLSLESKDPTQITHPSFFRNLTKSCRPFDNFFRLKNLPSPYKTTEERDSYYFISQAEKILSQYPLVLIVNHSDLRNIQLEIIDSSSYQARVEKYGHAFFQYFGLLPKLIGLNVNIFREYFSTSIGRQLIQLSLNGNLVKLKAKLKTLLVPSFILQTARLPIHLEEQFNFLNLDQEALLGTSGINLNEQLSSIEPKVLPLANEYPLPIMSRLINFKITISKLSKQWSHSGSLSPYKSPMVLPALLDLPSYPLLPENSEVYVEILSRDNHIHSPLQEVSFIEEEDNNHLRLTSGQEQQAKLHGDKELLSFINFILQSAIGTPTSLILQQIKIPRAEALKNILKNERQMSQFIDDSSEKIDQLINKLLQQQISPQINQDDQKA